MVRIAVVGLCGIEKVYDYDSDVVKERIGGVAANIARDLHHEYKDAYLFTSIARDDVREKIYKTNKGIPSFYHIMKSENHNMRYDVSVKNGEPKGGGGYFPTLKKEDFVDSAWDRMIESTDWVVAESSIFPVLLADIEKRSNNFMIVNSSTSKTKNMLNFTNFGRNKRVFTLNDKELYSLGWSGRAFGDCVWASDLLVTRGEAGWDYYAGVGTPIHGSAVEVPKGADFIGCGDAASAGLLHHLISGESVHTSISRYITRRLYFNTNTMNPENS